MKFNENSYIQTDQQKFWLRAIHNVGYGTGRDGPNFQLDGTKNVLTWLSLLQQFPLKIYFIDQFG